MGSLMSAMETFEQFLGSLSQQERQLLSTFTQNERTDLLAARSEDARVRIATAFIQEARERLRTGNRG